MDEPAFESRPKRAAPAAVFLSVLPILAVLVLGLTVSAAAQDAGGGDRGTARDAPGPARPADGETGPPTPPPRNPEPRGAQDDEAGPPPTRFTEDVVVVGSRARPRSVTESTTPIDAIPYQDVVSQGNTDVADRLRAVVPSYNVNPQPVGDAARLIRPANLRGLAPDHTLVLPIV